MPLRVGVIGCGNIFDIYLTNAMLFRDVEYVACADIKPDVAREQAAKYGLRAETVDALLSATDIDIVLNLTVPNAHFEVSLGALRAGKHVYTEKPLATSVEEGRKLGAVARTTGLRIGGAPDIFLGPSMQLARTLLEHGAIGDVVTGLSAFLGRGMEHWHPNPEFFYRKGTGPILDIGPYYVSVLTALLGPVRVVRSTGRIGATERIITSPGPFCGRTINVETFTTVNSLLSFQSGAEVVLMGSWDVWSHGVRRIELHGTAGSLRLPNPNWFDGDVELFKANADRWKVVELSVCRMCRKNYPWEGDHHANYRGVGLAEMAHSIIAGRPHRASGEFILHSLAVLTSIVRSAETGTIVEIFDTCEIPKAMTNQEADALFW